MSAVPPRKTTRTTVSKDVAALVPDFPFHYERFLELARVQGVPLFTIPAANHGAKVLVVGAGVSGAVAAYELLRMGLRPVLVEASGRIGGRLNSQLRGALGNQTIAELGAMRFPISGKAGMHYFTKVGMERNSELFPNPGSTAAVSTVVDYRGEQHYYENPPGDFPPKPEYGELIHDMFDPDAGFLSKAPIHFFEMQKAMTEGAIDQGVIKRIWNALLNHQKNSWNNLSLHAALVEVAKWEVDKIDLFGQIGFGTGGWNTDFPNCFLEVLRVLYTGLDVDHRLMLDGASSLPNRLITQTPRELGDGAVFETRDLSVMSTNTAGLGEIGFGNTAPFSKEVRHIRRATDGRLIVSITDTADGREVEAVFDAVVYTPHVRILDKFRHHGTRQQYAGTTDLLDPDTWKAIAHTHYMQSAKIFMATKRAFWHERDANGKRKMSVTLSDRLTRGTYLLDYGKSTGKHRGAGIFLSYTWNDDSLKFLGDRNYGPLLTHASMCRRVLQDIYPDVDLEEQLVEGSDSEIEINWGNEPLFLGAFKMNLPGHYEYQKRLFSQFMAGVTTGNPDRFVLAGDDTSWVGGWIEGAITSAINAVNKVAVVLGGGPWPNNQGPIDQWDRLKPVDLLNN